MTSAAITCQIGSLATEIGGLLSVIRGGREGDGVPDAGDDDLLAGAAAARLAGVNPATIWRAGNREEISFVETGGGGRKGNRKYRRGDVRRWVENRRQSKDVRSRVADLEEQLDALGERVTRLEEDR